MEQGKKMVDIACYNMNHSTIAMIPKEKIVKRVKSAVPMMLTIILRKLGKVMEAMKKLLSVWV